jgi:proline racemase
VILEQNCIYPLMSGHNTICVATALLYSGMVAIPEAPETEQVTVEFDLEAPAGEK